MNRIFFSTAQEWREWLRANHAQSDAIWLVYYKKETGHPTMMYEESIREALCYGWIDGLIKNLDEQRYMRRFSRRLKGSKWSDLNKKRVNDLISEKRMTRPGIEAVESAKQDGSWDQQTRLEVDLSMPAELEAALKKNPSAKTYFDTLTKNQRRNYIGWIVSAKRETTRSARIEEAIRLLSERRPLGMK